MKRIVIVFFLLLSFVVSAQRDTVWSRCPKYYYTDAQWYDTKPCYPDSFSVHIGNCGARSDSSGMVIFYHHTDTAITLYGLAGMIDWNMEMRAQMPEEILKTPEYFVLVKYDSVQNTFVVIDSARCDTARTKLFLIPTPGNLCQHWDVGGDTIHGFIREAYFGNDTGVTVNGDFYVGGTFRRNQVRRYHGIMWTGYTTLYDDFGNAYPWDSTCSAEHPNYDYWGGAWHRLGLANNKYSSFFGIVAEVNVAVLSDDSTKGTTIGTGRYGKGTTVRIEALPDSLHSFSHWNDGNRRNPRQFTALQDTTFIAYFDTVAYHKLNVTVNDTALGHATGSGYYPERSIVAISGVPNEGCEFVIWEDGVEGNPRMVTVTRDTTFTALLQEIQPHDTTGIATPSEIAHITLMPNPTDGKVTLSSSSPIRSIEIYSASGQLLQRVPCDNALRADLDLSSYVKGTYMLRILTLEGLVARKLVVQ